ncbi:MAG: hypothetical protein OMM_02260 [Candidatus Magnetoglobus multicellularis str. Araruama]|uniref:HEAT repeat domain-containing protein n=1 Tax=Candidatus Magnetoglobus multicellularis str. Araruama TaxID=890399 RepID=A0A1V1PAL9_9BACT|nr:MAG: hypothetical protein OMM_02260 [Candidatus Magnetoglobus multicellularis str. Araruama]
MKDLVEQKVKRNLIQLQLLIVIVLSSCTSNVSMLIKKLDDENVIIRKNAINSLGEMGTDAKKAIPYLIHSLNDDPMVKIEALKALKKIGSIPYFIELLDYPNSRLFAALVLVDMNSGSKEVIPVLIETLGSHDKEDRMVAAFKLGEIGPEAKEAVPILITILDYDKELIVRTAAAKALGKIGSDAKQAVPSLINALNSNNRILSNNAALALAEIGPEANEAVPFLIKNLDNNKSEVSNRAEYVLRKICSDSAGEQFLQLLLSELDHKYPKVRSVAALKIQNDFIPILIKGLHNKDVKIRTGIAIALGTIYSNLREKGFNDDMTAVPFLIKALGDDELEVRVATAAALGETRSKNAVPFLINSLNDPNDPLLRKTSASALGIIGSYAKKSLPYLIKALDDQDLGVRMKKMVEAWIEAHGQELLEQWNNAMNNQLITIVG